MVEYCMFIIAVFEKYQYVFSYIKFLTHETNQQHQTYQGVFHTSPINCTEKNPIVYIVLICLWFFVIVHASDSRFSLLNDDVYDCLFLLELSMLYGSFRYYTLLQSSFLFRFESLNLYIS